LVSYNKHIQSTLNNESTKCTLTSVECHR